MTHYEPQNLEPLLALFNVRSKTEAERYCRTLVIHRSDLAALITASKVGVLHPYIHGCRYKKTLPEHLKPKQSELAAAASLKVGPLEGEARKLFRKSFQSFEEWRLFAAHLLYTPDHAYWHILYFDQRDIDGDNSHWDHGPHIHYANDTFHRGDLEEIWARVSEGDTAFLKPIHIRFHQ
jgi:hypothetical protein